MTAHRLLDRLDKVRQTSPDRWIACCPAHDDKTPSLSIRQAEDRILVFCFSGCHVEDVLTAVGLSFSDLYLDESRAAYEAACAHGGREIERKAKKFDPIDHERLIVEIAEADLRAGRVLNLEDSARVELALERLGFRLGGAA